MASFSQYIWSISGKLRLFTSNLVKDDDFVYLLRLTFFHLGTRSACINAAMLALADAGKPMRDIVTSCGAGYLCTTPLLGMFVPFLIYFPWFSTCRFQWFIILNYESINILDIFSTCIFQVWYLIYEREYILIRFCISFISLTSSVVLTWSWEDCFSRL